MESVQISCNFPGENLKDIGMILHRLKGLQKRKESSGLEDIPFGLSLTFSPSFADIVKSSFQLLDNPHPIADVPFSLAQAAVPGMPEDVPGEIGVNSDFKGILTAQDGGSFPLATGLAPVLVRAAKLSRAEGEVRLNLLMYPPEWGKLRVEMKSRKEKLEIKLSTVRAEVKEILEINVSQLREALVRQGLHVGELSVELSSKDFSSAKDDKEHPFIIRPSSALETAVWSTGSEAILPSERLQTWELTDSRINCWA
ncbi:MAG: flagellar hook-length control protein FliK [bacterium]